MYWDSTYYLVLLGVALCAIASWNVSSTYKRYSQVRNSRGLPAQEVAAQILQRSGIYDVRIERVSGSLTDHYSPNEKVLRLSDSVYGSASVAAIGVAAHECGHAIQHHIGYAPLKLRSASVPIANFGSRLYWPIILLGLLMGYMQLAQIGIVLFAFVVFFQLITLPVEFDASRRALGILSGNALLWEEEMKGARKVLTAAAMTYVASLFSSILQMLRLILLTSRRDNR